MKEANVSRMSAAGQNNGAVARAAVINAALSVRDTVANTVAPRATSGAKVALSYAKGSLAYGVGFVRNFVGK